MTDFWEILTIETNSKKQIDEFIKKYKGTFLWLTHNGKKTLVQLNDFKVDEGYSDATFYFNYSETGTLEIKYKTKNTLSALFPKSGCVTIRNNLAICRRIPARQYRRAPCQDNYNIFLPYKALIRAGHENLALSISHLEACYNPCYIPMDVLHNNLFSNVAAEGGAISNKWGMTKHSQVSDKLILWFGMYPIAEIDVDKNIELLSTHFKQEVEDLLRDEASENFHIKDTNN